MKGQIKHFMTGAFGRKIAQLERQRVIEKLKGMKEEKVTFGKNPDMSMPYNQMLMGYAEAIDQMIKEVEGM